MSPSWWEACYSDEKPYPIKYAGTRPYDADSDGDGVLDGADDQDFDDVPNIMELSRNMAGDCPIQAEHAATRRVPHDPTCRPQGAREPVQPVPAGPRTRARARATRSIGAAYPPFDPTGSRRSLN